MAEQELTTLHAAHDKITSGRYTEAIVELQHLEGTGSLYAAQYLGYLHHRGLGCQRNLEKAKAYYLKAAKNGSLVAQSNLANILSREGQIDDAKKWYRAASEHGHTQAFYGLYRLLSKSAKTVDERNEAINLLEKAAIAGHPFARRDLLILELTGKMGISRLLLAVVKAPASLVRIWLGMTRNVHKGLYDLGQIDTL